MNKIYLERRNVYSYPDATDLYAPHVKYPEYPFDVFSESENEVYDMIRSTLYSIGLDKKHFGAAEWNPLGVYIKPGDLVIIKPNLVKSYDSIAQYECTLTHTSVVKAMIDYCVIAKAGHIVVGDAPIQGADMDKIITDCHINEIIRFYQNKGISIEFCDFRDLIVESKHGLIITKKDEKLYSGKDVVVHLENRSEHCRDFFDGKYRVAGYVDQETNELHHGETHDYIITQRVLDADCIINLPKPKTHRYAGLTGAQKNFIGCCSDKESLPHYRAGSPCVGGDETDSNSLFPKILAKCDHKFLWACKKKQYVRAMLYQFIYRGLNWIKGDRFFSNGQWYGNDTIWRTIIDLNKIMLYADKEGNMHMDVPQRKIFTLGDMIIVGEKAGPLEPTPKPLGVIMAADNMAIFDYVFCKITGFDETLIPTIHHSVRNTHLSPENWKEIVISSNDERVDGKTIFDVTFPEEYWLEPHPFWKDLLLKSKNR